MSTRAPGKRSTELDDALSLCTGSLVHVGIFSLISNLLMLTPTIYMLSVYDRALPSSSESTLLMLTLIMLFLYVVMGGIEWVRTQIMVAVSARFDQALSPRVFDAQFTLALMSGGRGASTQPLADLIQLRQFLTGPGLFAFFDAPWLPLYLALLFLFHWQFGVTGVVSMLVLAGLAFWNEKATQPLLEQANRESVEASQSTQRNLRNAEVIDAMGMLGRMRGRWSERQRRMLTLQSRASARGGAITAASKFYRMAIQSLVLGLGAYLAIHKEISAGVVISGSVLLGRAMAPLDLMIGNWRGFVGARSSYQRLRVLLGQVPPAEDVMALPPPVGEFVLEQVTIAPPGGRTSIIKGVNLLIKAGDLVAIIGPSAAGKSTLARALLGVYKPSSGSVRLDGAEIHHWPREQFGHHVGYLPQDVEILDGTVAENIARFGDIDADKVIEAARAAGIHEMVLKLPDGYETMMSAGMATLSAGQYQRIGIARALYGNPQVLVLDEPNSNLDQTGEAALLETLMAQKRAGRTVVVVTHRQNILGVVDNILMLVDGAVATYGPRAKVLEALAQAQQRASAPPALSGASA